MKLLRENKLSNDEKNIAIQQYQAYIENIDRNSDRRINANNFYIALNSALFTIATLFFNNIYICIVLYLLGVIFSSIWLLNLRNYKNLSSCKFSVIQEMEKHLPFPIFTYEWYKLDNGKNRKKYIPVTTFESMIPIIFIVLFVVLIFIQILNKVHITITIK